MLVFACIDYTFQFPRVKKASSMTPVNTTLHHPTVSMPNLAMHFTCSSKTIVHSIIYIYNYYVIATSRYEHDIQVITQDRGKAKVAGDDQDIM